MEENCEFTAALPSMTRENNTLAVRNLRHLKTPTGDVIGRASLCCSGFHQGLPQGPRRAHQEIRHATDGESGDRLAVNCTGKKRKKKICCNLVFINFFLYIYLKVSTKSEIILNHGFIKIQTLPIYLQVASKRGDRRLNFARFSSDVTIHTELGLRSSNGT